MGCLGKIKAFAPKFHLLSITKSSFLSVAFLWRVRYNRPVDSSGAVGQADSQRRFIQVLIGCGGIRGK
jgi:hypothetical protein